MRDGHDLEGHGHAGGFTVVEVLGILLALAATAVIAVTVLLPRYDEIYRPTSETWGYVDAAQDKLAGAYQSALDSGDDPQAALADTLAGLPAAPHPQVGQLCPSAGENTVWFRRDGGWHAGSVTAIIFTPDQPDGVRTRPGSGGDDDAAGGCPPGVS